MVKEKEAIEEAARNPTASPKTLLGNLSVNDTAKNVNAVSYLRNQAAFEKAVQKELAKLVANVEIFQVLITVIKIYKVILHPGIVCPGFLRIVMYQYLKVPYVLLRNVPIQRLSLSMVCPIHGLSYPWFVHPGFVHPGFVHPRFVLSYVCPSTNISLASSTTLLHCHLL